MQLNRLMKQLKRVSAKLIMNTQPIYDLHSHTTASDGELTPQELVQQARSTSISALAITDHDTLDGIPNAVQAAQKLGEITVIPGIEISSLWGTQDIHILGLNIDPLESILKVLVRQQKQCRAERAMKIGEKLAKLGHLNFYKKASELAQSEAPGRPHFAKVLLREGICKSTQKAFTTYLGQGKKAYVKTEWVSMQNAIAAIESAGGIATLAHPGKYKCTRSKLTRMVNDFSEAGGKAIEVSTSTHTPEDIKFTAQLALQNNLYSSTGSDFHGPSSGWSRLGKFPLLPASCRPVWELFSV